MHSVGDHPNAKPAEVKAAIIDAATQASAWVCVCARARARPVCVCFRAHVLTLRAGDLGHYCVYVYVGSGWWWWGEMPEKCYR